MYAVFSLMDQKKEIMTLIHFSHIPFTYTERLIKTDESR